MQGSPPGLAGSFNARTIGFAASSGLWYRRASNLTSAVWMPDGQSILTTATRDPEADSIFAYYDLLRVPVPLAEGLAATVDGTNRDSRAVCGLERP